VQLNGMEIKKRKIAGACLIEYQLHCRNIRQEIGNYYPDPELCYCLRNSGAAAAG